MPKKSRRGKLIFIAALTALLGICILLWSWAKADVSEPAFVTKLQGVRDKSYPALVEVDGVLMPAKRFVFQSNSDEVFEAMKSELLPQGWSVSVYQHFDPRGLPKSHQEPMNGADFYRGNSVCSLYRIFRQNEGKAGVTIFKTPDWLDRHFFNLRRAIRGN